jgi:hypothetical protein
MNILVIFWIFPELIMKLPTSQISCFAYLCPLLFVSLCILGLSLLLVSEVTPGLLTGAEPNAHQFYVTIVLMGDQMGRDSGRYRSNSGTESGM